MRKAHWRWGVVVKVLKKKGATVRAREMMYKAVFQKVLLYGRNSWAVMEAMLKVMEGFHHHVARSIAGVLYRRVGEEGWECSSVSEVLEAEGM